MTGRTLQPTRGRPHVEALRWHYGSKRDKKDEAKKVDELKKQLGDKWNEVTGQKSNN